MNRNNHQTTRRFVSPFDNLRTKISVSQMLMLNAHSRSHGTPSLPKNVLLAVLVSGVIMEPHEGGIGQKDASEGITMLHHDFRSKPRR